MFQFPGFAFLTLCIQVKNTWFSSLKTTCAVYNELSGGLPHSEIHGSQLILSSPWLIAEYHVLHRLLLPRHSPNALLALDLIQKKTGLLHFLASCPEGQLDQKHTFPLQAVRAWNCGRSLRTNHLVSVLDLDSALHLRREATGYLSGRTSIHTMHLVYHAAGSKPKACHTRQAA